MIFKKVQLLLNVLILSGLGILTILCIKSNYERLQQNRKDQVIIQVLLTYHRDVLHQNLNPDLLYEDGLRWVDDPQYNAVKYPR